MRQIIKAVSREEALKGFVITLGNGEKSFVCDGELNGYPLLVGSYFCANFNKTAKGKHLQYCILDDQRLVKAPQYPFRSYEEALLYAGLPHLLRHLAAMVKVQNASCAVFPVPEITYLLNAVWQMSLYGGREMPKLSGEIVRLFPEADKNEVEAFLTCLAVRVEEDKGDECLDGENIGSSAVFGYFAERFPQICFDSSQYEEAFLH